jgi:predicted nucleotidyltransferase
MDTRVVPHSPLGERLIEHRAAILAAANRRHASNVRVFGSLIRGHETSDSDIDLLVDLDTHATPFDLLELGCDLEDELGVKVDTGTPGSLRAFLRDEVLADAFAL